MSRFKGARNRELAYQLEDNRLRRLLMLRVVGQVSPDTFESHCDSNDQELLSVLCLSATEDEKGNVRLERRQQDLYGELQATTRSIEDEPVELQLSAGELGKALGLSELEQQVLTVFACMYEHDTGALLDMVPAPTHPALVRMIAVMIERPPHEIAPALRHDAALYRCKLIERVSEYPNRDLSDCLKLEPDAARVLFDPGFSLDDYRRCLLGEPQSPNLAVQNYPHLAEDIATVSDLLDHAIAENRCGLNILLYGPPGSGKTELARVLATSTGRPVHGIPNTDMAGTPLKATERLNGLTLAYRLVNERRKVVLIADECEDLLEDGGAGDLLRSRTAASASKVWKNQLLETNPVPTIWIANDVSNVEAAILRRFTYCVGVHRPPRSVMCELVKQSFGGLISDTFARNLQESEVLMPAHLATMRELLEGTSSSTTRAREKLLARYFNNRPDSTKKLRVSNAGGFELPYRVEWLNASLPIVTIVEKIRAREEGRVLLSGLPGTGKTAFVRHLAESLDVDLVIKRASDLLSPYHGMTEQFLAQAFQRAETDGCLLFIDEADSLLRGREHANRSWEVSQVNELLTQIDAFGGVLALATNNPETLDGALLRRIDHKIELKPMTRAQAQACLTAAAIEMGLTGDDVQTQITQVLASAPAFTFGDLATAARKVAPGGANDALDTFAEFVCDARVEFDQRTRQARQIGFLAC